MPPAAAEQPIAERAEQRATPSPISVLMPIRLAAGRAGEGAVGDRVRDERRAAQDDEEPDDAGDDGDDAATSQALTMNPENIGSEPRRSLGAVGGAGQARQSR